MKRRTFGLAILGAAGAATAGGIYAFWEDAPPAPPISLTVEQNHLLVPAETTSDMWALIRVGAEEINCDDRPPINVGLVIDTSGSMEGEPIEAARQAAADVVETLRDGDRLTIVTFHSRAELVVEPTVIDSGTRDDALEKIAAVEAKGTTDLAGGLQLAANQIASFVEAGTVTRLVLLSDGVPNDATSIPSIVSGLAGNTITVTALGFGLDYDETLLGTIAQQTGGAFHYVEDAAAIAPIFREENARIQGVVAKGISLRLTTGPNVQIAEVAGNPVGEPEDGVALGLGDLSRGEERVVGVRLRVAPHRDGAPVELLDVVVSYVDPTLSAGASLEPVFLAARATKDLTAVETELVKEVEAEVQQLQAAAAMLQAISFAREGDRTRATQILRGAAPKAGSASTVYKSPKLAEQATELESLADEIDAAEQTEENIATKGKRRHLSNEYHRNAMDNFQAQRKN